MSNELGIDRSGNNNSWTVNNMTLAADQMLDSPTNNFATFNPLAYRTVNSPTIALSQGNLQCMIPIYGEVFGNMFPSTGKWYLEVLWQSVTYDGLILGIAPSNDGTRGIWNPAVFMNIGDGQKGVNGSWANYGVSTAGAGDIIGISFNFTDDEVIFYVNGSSQGTISNALAAGAGLGYGLFFSGERNGTIVLNHGQDSSFAGNKTAQGNQDGNGIGDFYYAPPANHLALCTANLPDIDIIPSEHFNTVLYTGDDADDRSITGVGFQPDFVWLKSRSNATNHYLYDSIRGANKQLLSNADNEESDTADRMQAFESNGFQLGTSSEVNGSSRTYVAWNWKANGSGSSNTDGDRTSTVSVNTDAGFSIVSYSGDGTGNFTVGHGLGSTPDTVIVKRRDNTSNWYVWHKDLTSGSYVIYLNATNAQADEATVWNDVKPTSSVFTIGTDANLKTTDDYIAYCFHSVDGYSKVGSYTGNSNANGTFVYTGFQPSFVIIKRYTTTESWMMFDNAREPYNEMKTRLLADVTDADEDNQVFGDFVSNGFKMRSTWGGVNDSSHSYIYIAFAETPFKYANGR